MTWIRKHKKYSKPKKLLDAGRIEQENVFLNKYGLKNKREIWKAESQITRFRRQAKKLITASVEEQEKFLDKLKKIGLKIDKIADVLALNVEDLLKRRLQSIVFGKKITSKIKAARQLITHKHIAINDKIVNIPSYIVPLDEEDKITVLLKKKKEEKTIKEKESSEKIDKKVIKEEKGGPDGKEN